VKVAGRAVAPTTIFVLLLFTVLREGRCAPFRARRSLTPHSTVTQNEFCALCLQACLWPCLATRPPRCLPAASQMPSRCPSTWPPRVLPEASKALTTPHLIARSPPSRTLLWIFMFEWMGAPFRENVSPRAPISPFRLGRNHLFRRCAFVVIRKRLKMIRGFGHPKTPGTKEPKTLGPLAHGPDAPFRAPHFYLP